ncbi:hypothetical protein B9G55_12105 [Saccharibacillus sp. O16]|nr:hypothetical protein B9G55_12105 [Saccharibacillus sp. O16]
MTRSIINMFMTIRNFLTLRNLLAFLCAAALIAVILKGFQIEDKIRLVGLADDYYARNQRLSAETTYTAALDNTVIRYRDDHIRTRLAELQPLTRMREEVLKSKGELMAAANAQDLESYLAAYEVYDAFEQLSLDGEYAAEYRELSRRYEMTTTIAHGFTDFRTAFEQSLNRNLENGDYSSESAKWDLLRIPALFFTVGTESAGTSPASSASKQQAVVPDENTPEETAEAMKSEHLNALFRDYDQRKLKKLAAAGRYTDMLSEASRTLEAYRQNDFQAPWVQLQAEDTSDLVLRHDLETQSYAVFAAHARSFADFADQNDLSSTLTDWIETTVNELLRRADSLITDQRFEEGIALYQAMNGYRDTDAQVAQAEEAWTQADPLRILQLAYPSHTYRLVISGKNRFGVHVYVAALDEQGTLYWGTNGDGGKSVWTNLTPLTPETVRSLRLDEQLSTEDQPVLVAETDSSSRQATYIAVTPQQDGAFTTLFQFEADGYAVEDGGMTLKVKNPSEAKQAGQIAIYTRYSDRDAFTFAGWENNYLDIGSASPVQYPQQVVRTKVTLLQAGSGQALAQTGTGEWILLRGHFDLTAGTYEITGTFREQYEQVEDPSSTSEASEKDDAVGPTEDQQESANVSEEPAAPANDPSTDSSAGADSDVSNPTAPSDSNLLGPSPAPEPGSGTNGDGLEESGDSMPEAAPEQTLISVPVFEVDAVEPS